MSVFHDNVYCIVYIDIHMMINIRLAVSWVNQHQISKLQLFENTIYITPQKSNIDTKNGNI